MKYITVKKGKLEQWVGKGQEPIVLEKIEGKLTSIKTEKDSWEGNEFDNLILDLDNGEKFKIKCRLDSGYARALINTLSNANLADPVELKPFLEDKKSGFFVSQGGKALKWKFTKANPNGLPPMKEVVFNGKKLFDRTDQNEFYKKTVEELDGKFKVTVENDLPF